MVFLYLENAWCLILVNDIRYPDDLALLTSSETNLQTLLNTLQMLSKKLGLNLNINKTKVMAVSKKSPEPLISIRD